ncbi:MAG: hypothetical protein NZ853_01785 [Leptospiraceae bacterium]|nr:hypothetical protein [Leptospiraceae bacterium]MDW7976042.1 hypothetical protein [Leptospiraceae bacterium]
MKHQKEKKQAWLRVIQSLDPSFFDGHTEFSRLTLEERIMWLMQITIFLFEVSNELLSKQSA